MSFKYLPIFLLATCQLQASPLNVREVVVTVTKTASSSSTTAVAWNEEGVQDFPIHESCNSTERAQLERALGETIKIAQHAKEHLLRWGNQSSIVQKYFGNASTAEPIGWFSRVVGADRASMTFRCDDPDGNCATQSGWAGHWRGENATQETIICPLSFTKRLPLEAVCGQGYTIANSPLNTYFAVDLLHRVFHVPAISEDVVSHYAEDYVDVLGLAKENSTFSVRDSDTLQYFAIEAYAYDIAVPGVGCTGELEEQTTSSTTPQATTPVASPVLQSEDTTSTSSAATSCHTHADGMVHCESE